MEVTSKEEVHILALFGSEENLFSLQAIVHENLPGTNDEKRYGEQVIVNEKEEVLGFSDKLLIGATSISLERLVDLIHEREGLAIAAHVDREGFGLLGQLGFVPEELPLDALELADPSKRDGIAQGNRWPFITSSDAHKLEDIGRQSTTFWMKAANTAEVRQCLSGVEGRRTRI